MIARSNVQRPRILGIVVLCASGGLLNIGGGIILYNQINELIRQGGTPYDWALRSVYFAITLGGLQLLAAVLVFQFKRFGLYLCGCIFIVVILTNIYSFAFSSTPASIAGIALASWALYYVYRYLTHEPQRSFFT